MSRILSVGPCYQKVINGYLHSSFFLLLVLREASVSVINPLQSITSYTPFLLTSYRSLPFTTEPREA